MNLQEKLSCLMKEKGVNKRQLAIKCNLSYGAIDGIFKVSYENMKLTTFKTLCSFFNVTMDSMAWDDREIEYRTDQTVRYSHEDAEMVRKFHSISAPARGIVSSALDAAYAQQEAEDKKDGSLLLA